MEEFELDDSNVESAIDVTSTGKRGRKKVASESVQEDKPMVNCLRREIVSVKFIPKETSLVKDKNHVLSGGMARGAYRTFVVPRLKSGRFVNVLTNEEKAFLEHIMGLDEDALSIYKANNNFWDDSNPNGISTVRLSKDNNYLDLSDVGDFIRYKILLANKDLIAPSVQSLQDYPKATYQFVIVSEGEENKQDLLKLDASKESWKEYGKIEAEKDILRLVIETIEGRPTAPNSKLEFLQVRVGDLIATNPKLFLAVVKDPMLKTKVLIQKALEQGLIYKRNDYYYLKDGNVALCENNENSTLSNAAKYLNSPRHQEVLFNLQTKLK